MSDSVWPHGQQPTRFLCPWDFPGKSTGVGCHCLLHTARVEQIIKYIADNVSQFSQSSMLETESENCSVVSDSLQPHGLYSPWNSLGQNTGVGSLSLLQGIFPIQGSNPGLPCCRRILYQLSRKGSPRILEWVAYPFSSGSSWPRNWTGVSCIAGGFFPNWAIREARI